MKKVNNHLNTTRVMPGEEEARMDKYIVEHFDEFTEVKKVRFVGDGIDHPRACYILWTNDETMRDMADEVGFNLK